MEVQETNNFQKAILHKNSNIKHLQAGKKQTNKSAVQINQLMYAYEMKDTANWFQFGMQAKVLR